MNIVVLVETLEESLQAIKNLRPAKWDNREDMDAYFDQMKKLENIIRKTREEIAMDTTVRRFTENEIRDMALAHYAYGWSASPGTHNRFRLWEKEDTDTYMRFYNLYRSEGEK